VAGAQFKIDDGTLQPLVLDNQGRFSAATAFALDAA